MKLAVSATQPEISASFEPRFGRCAYFIVIDSESGAWKALPNPAVNASGGAGTQSAQLIAGEGVQAVISGSFGPSAYAALHAAGIQMFQTDSSSVEQVLQAFRAGELQRITQPGGAGGRGRGRA